MATSDKTQQTEQTKKRATPKRTAKLDSPQGQTAAPVLVQLALADPTAVAPTVILALQRSHGNRAVQRLITRSQNTQADSESAVAQPELPLHAEPAFELNEPLAEFVPPVAPPATPLPGRGRPPPTGNPWHRVGSPYRHLDGISNRKIQTKFSAGPAADRFESAANAITHRNKRQPAQATEASLLLDASANKEPK